MFDWLAEEARVEKTVSLDSSRGFRGLVTTRDVQRGEVVLEVPSNACLWSTRDGVVSGLYGQTDMCWEAAGDLREPVSDEDFARGLTWDLRLALALMEATADPQIGGRTWHLYGSLLPPPHTVTVPFCLPERLLVQLHNDGMATRARKQVNRLRSLFPQMMESLLVHPKTAVYARKPGGGDAQAGVSTATDVAPAALAWAFAMVRSRAFAAGDDRFAFVPFLDMANHDFAPTTNFTYEDPGVFRLRALRDLPAGEEATISYGQRLDAEQLMVQYGFPAPLDTPVSRPLMDAGPLQGGAIKTGAERTGATGELGAVGGWEEQEEHALMDELLLRGQQMFERKARGDPEAFDRKVRQALPLIPRITAMVGKLGGKDGASGGANVLLQKLQTYRSENFPTSADQDEELLGYCLGDGRSKVDPRLAQVVRYRIARKRTHALAEDLLEEYLAPQPSS